MLPAHHGEGLGAGDHGIGYQRGVKQHQDRQDDENQGQDADNAEQGIDIDSQIIETGNPAQEQVDQPVGRVQQEHPADREQDVRDHHRDDGDDSK